MALGDPGDFGAVFRHAGETTAAWMTNRLINDQYEKWVDGPQSEFEASLREAEGIMQQDFDKDPEGISKGILMYKAALNTYTNEASRFPNNPKIAGASQQQIAYAQQGMNEIYGLAETKQNVAESRAKEDELGASADLKRAQAAKLRKDTAGGPERPEQIPYLSGQPGTVANSAQLYTNISANIDRPSTEADRKAIQTGMAEIRTALAQQKLSEILGTDKGDNTRWTMTDENLKSVAATMIDPARVRDAFLLKKMREEGPLVHRVNPQEIEDNFGFLENPEAASPFRVTDRSLTDNQILGQVLGADVLLGLKQGGINVNNITAVGRALPDEIADLGFGPLQSGFRTVLLAGGGIPHTSPPTQFKTPAQIRSWIEAFGNSKIDEAIGGRGVADNQLNVEARKARVKARNLLKAMLDKYTNPISGALGVGPKSLRPKDTEFLFPEKTSFGEMERGMRRGGAALGSFLERVTKPSEVK